MTTEKITVPKQTFDALREALVAAGNFISPYSRGEQVLEKVDAALTAANAVSEHVPEVGFGKIVGTYGKVVEWPSLPEQPHGWSGDPSVQDYASTQPQAQGEATTTVVNALLAAAPLLYKAGHQQESAECNKALLFFTGVAVPAHPQATEPAWSPIESAPKLTQVLIFYRNLLGNGRTVKARFVPRFSEECGDFDESEHVREYDEKGDCFTLIEGWYEQIDNWDDFSEVYISGVKPTHWMPLPAAPEAP